MKGGEAMSLFATTAADAASDVPFPKVRVLSLPLTGMALQLVPLDQLMVPLVPVKV